MLSGQYVGQKHGTPVYTQNGRGRALPMMGLGLFRVTNSECVKKNRVNSNCVYYTDDNHKKKTKTQSNCEVYEKYSCEYNR